MTVLTLDRDLIGFGNGRFIFNSVTGFQNYATLGRGYVECTGLIPFTVTGTCPGGETPTGPVVLYLQQVGVGGRTVEQAGTQVIPQQDIAVFIQDNWKATPNITVNYGLRWEGQKQPDPITPPSQRRWGASRLYARVPATVHDLLTARIDQARRSIGANQQVRVVAGVAEDGE